VTSGGPFRPLIDRASKVPIGLQLRGQVEYAIACGQLEPGARLPTVRALARRLGVSPVTVSQVYGELQRRALLVAKAGRGTFVAPDIGMHVDPDATRRLDAMMDDIVHEGRRLGLDGDDLVRRFGAHMARRSGSTSPPTVLLVGLFPEVTDAYARQLQRLLERTARVRSTTFGQLDRGPAAARGAHLVVTFPYRVAELERLMPAGPPVTYLRFLPTEATRVALAGIDPRSRVLGVAALPSFLPSLEAGIASFASHVTRLEFCLLDDPALSKRATRANVVVYASGAETVRDLTDPTTTSIEFRHTPDPAFVEEHLAPILAALRSEQVTPVHPRDDTSPGTA